MSTEINQANRTLSDTRELGYRVNKSTLVAGDDQLSFIKREDQEDNLIDEVKSVQSLSPSTLGEAAGTCWKKLRFCLEFISVGQYYTKLYHNGKGT